MKAGADMIQYVFGMFTGGFITVMVMALFIGRRQVDDEYKPDIYRSKDDDWELWYGKRLT